MASPLGFLRRLSANASVATRGAIAAAYLPRRLPVWVQVRLAPPLEEHRRPSWLFSRPAPQTLLDVLLTLRTAADDPRVDGVLLRLEGAPRGWSKALAVRRAVEHVRERGKDVVAWGEMLGPGDLLVASAANRLWIPEAGVVEWVGLRAESIFLRGLLEHVGARPEIVRIGTHKTAAETFTRDSMSPEQREQSEALLNDVFEVLVERVAHGRGLEPDAVRALADRGPFRGRDAVSAGLVDDCLYPDEIEGALDEMTRGERESGEPRARLVDGTAYAALRGERAWQPLWREPPRVGYVVASGTIHRGQGPRGVASDTYRRLLERLRLDRSVRGVVLRIESPGGDGLASDLIWRAVSQVSRDKPVVVSLGDVAASGGYYVAAAGDAVFAEPTSVTGSIGVVGGKINLEKLYERLGIAKDAVERGARAGLGTETRPFTSEERAAVRADMESVYSLFVERVAAGRELSREDVERCAQGRVWSGAAALRLGLVDALGGPLEALREVCRRAGLPSESGVAIDVHPRIHFAGLRSWLGFLAGLWGR